MGSEMTAVVLLLLFAAARTHSEIQTRSVIARALVNHPHAIRGRLGE